MSREEMMQELTTMRKVVSELESVILLKDPITGLETLVQRYRKEAHDLGNRIMVLDAKKMGLTEDELSL